MEIINKRIEEYIQDLYPTKDPVLKEMEILAVRKDFPIVGPAVADCCTSWPE